MIGAARLILRQADEALKNERLEDAHRLLRLAEGQNSDADPLWQRLTRGFLRRAEQRLALGDSEDAWSDLLNAEQIGTTSADSYRLRHALSRRGLDQVRVLLTAGEPGCAVGAVAE